MKHIEFCEFLQQVGLKTRNLKSQQGWLGYKPKGTALLLCRSQATNPGADDLKTQIEKYLGHTMGRGFTLFQVRP